MTLVLSESDTHHLLATGSTNISWEKYFKTWKCIELQWMDLKLKNKMMKEIKGDECTQWGSFTQ
jgi:hypothetical protein